jgi:hypothetical protein
MIRYLLAALIAACPFAASAQTAVAGARGPDWIAIAMFALIVLATLVITDRSAGKTKSKADFYSAGNAITPVQNGLAIAGDFLSAAAFLVRDLCPRLCQRLRWTPVRPRLPHGLADRPVSDVGADAQSRKLHVRRRRCVPA